MANFRFVRNEANRVGNPRLYSIAATTAIEKGEVVKLTNGLVVAVGDKYCVPIHRNVYRKLS